MSGPVTAYLALGANTGDRAATIASAVACLDREERVTVTAMSSVIETAPVGGPGQGPYLNAVLETRTSLDPRRLLALCLAVEARHGRDRRRETRWGPRSLDVDLLLYGDRVIDEPGLTVPHPRLHARRFVLEPLTELAASLVHPVLGRSIECLRDGLRPTGVAEERGGPRCSS